MREHSPSDCGFPIPETAVRVDMQAEYAKALEVINGQRETIDRLKAALKELLDAGDEAVTTADDVASMLRFGQATDAARLLVTSR